MALSLLDPRTFYFYITMENNGRILQVPLPEDLTEDGLVRTLKDGLKRFSRGFLKTVALYTPPSTPPMPQYGIPGSGKSFRLLRKVLGQEYSIVDTDLKKGRVPEEADFLLLVAPKNLDKKQLFAVDQFLMQGGSVAIAAAPFDVNLQGQLRAEKYVTGLDDWLAHMGITMKKTMVLDEQNSAFPIPVERQVGMFRVRETRLINYPYFLDIRPSGMTDTEGLLAGIRQLSLSWASPIVVDSAKDNHRHVVELLHSSPRSWTSDSLNIQPDFEKYGPAGFKVGDDLGPKTVGLLAEGTFNSWFAGKPSPLLSAAEKDKEKKDTKGKTDKDKTKAKKDEKITIGRVIAHSPESARIFLFSSNTFLTDTAIGLLSSVLHTGYQAPVQLMTNVVDWSLEDRGLLAIRGRSQFARTLLPLSRKEQMFWEYLNYGLAGAGLLLIWLLRVAARNRSRTYYHHILANGRIKA